jgi:VIT1/CCC1 family predicted Fe2+/Mn2+ transporter
MKPNELLSTTGETIEYARQYIQQQVQYLRLETAKRIAMTTSSLITLGVVGVLILMVVIFLSIALGFYLGALFNSYALAFLIIAGVYFLVVVLVIYFKKEIVTNPILNMVIKNMLD